MEMDMAEDVVFSILLRLPVKSLLRFKAVCRSWRSTIESSAFISQHLHHHHHHHLVDDLDTWNLLVWQSNPFTTRKLVISLLSGNNFQLCHNLKEEFQLELGTIPRIVATCDGMVCLYHGDYPDISLWNPATRELVTLSRAPQPNPDDAFFASFGFGFGYDVITNDYKVVKFFIDDKRYSLHNITTDVCSLSTNSWRTIEHALLVNCNTHIMSDPNSSWQNGGIYYWMGARDCQVNEEIGREHLIFYFDFSSEKFGTVAAPAVFSGFEYFLYLGNLRENIACIGCGVSYSIGTQVWVLNRSDGVWTQLSTVEDSGCFSGMSKNGKIVWSKIKGSRNLYLSDPVTHERNILPVEEPLDYFQVAQYKESLISIKGHSPS